LRRRKERKKRFGSKETGSDKASKEYFKQKLAKVTKVFVCHLPSAICYLLLRSVICHALRRLTAPVLSDSENPGNKNNHDSCDKLVPLKALTGSVIAE
jgi:hypothetical protein